ncbi:cell division cycle protein 27 homolog [Plakobranchus ocellatus]|uniref:Cell division cycle protein 27 homolog n=1 Tax=Plakobranchus ocellatus TaxID=259542 RepID=A0AAV3ZL52_9GAST|nr:cell division cycle protein 27 homolog [Plakobranchus ocellatus]
MLLQEPVQAAIWDALNNYSYSNAIFLAERLYAEISNNESLHLLATCYYRAGRPNQAYMLLEKACSQTPQCKFLKAKCCSDLNKYNEVEQILAGTILTKIKSPEDIEAEFGSLACYVFALLGCIYSKTDREKKACQFYRRSLTLNPLLWKSYEALCHLGEEVKADTVFQIPSQSGNVAVDALAPSHSPALDPLASGDHQHGLHQQQQQQQLGSTIDHSNSTNTTFSIASSEKLLSPRNIYPNKTPENVGPPPASHPHLHDPSKAPRPNKQRAVLPSAQILRRSKLFANPVHVSPSFGMLPVENPVPVPGSATPSFISPVPTESQALEVQAPIKTRPMTRRTQMGKSPVLNWSNTLRKMNEKELGNAPIRRSSRLFTNSNSNSSAVKENNKSQTQPSLTGTRGVNRRSKRTPKSQEELNEINKGDEFSTFEI